MACTHGLPSGEKREFWASFKTYETFCKMILPSEVRLCRLHVVYRAHYLFAGTVEECCGRCRAYCRFCLCELWLLKVCLV